MNGFIFIWSCFNILCHVIHWLVGDAVVGPLTKSELFEAANATVSYVGTKVIYSIKFSNVWSNFGFNKLAELAGGISELSL